MGIGLQILGNNLQLYFAIFNITADCRGGDERRKGIWGAEEEQTPGWWQDRDVVKDQGEESWRGPSLDDERKTGIVIFWRIVAKEDGLIDDARLVSEEGYIR